MKGKVRLVLWEIGFPELTSDVLDPEEDWVSGGSNRTWRICHVPA